MPLFLATSSHPQQFESVSIDPALLDELARTFPLSVRQLADAGALVVGLAGHEARLGMPGAENATPSLGALVRRGSSSPGRTRQTGSALRPRRPTRTARFASTAGGKPDGTNKAP